MFLDRSLRSAAQSAANDATANKEERLMLLEAWRDFELQFGDETSLASVTNLLPKRVKKRRRIQTQDGVYIMITVIISIIFILLGFSRAMLVGKNFSTTFSQRMKPVNLILSF